MIKVYEAIRQNHARLVTNYLGLSVTLNFVDGNIYAGKNAQLRTNDKFIQDAIEHDSRFGVTIKLKQKYKEPSDDEAETSTNENEQPVVTEAVKEPKKKASKKKAEVAEGEAVDSVTSLNDAIDFFAEKGEFLEGPEQLEELCSKYGVTFPNLK